MKKIIGGIFLIMSAIVFPSLTQAAEVDVKQLSSHSVFFNDFDVVAVEFELQDVQDETLQTVTIQHNGTARPGIDFTNLTLWADASLDGFQGWGFDTNLGVATVSNGVYVFNSLQYFISQPNQTFYVTLETTGNLDTKNSQFEVQPYNDKNGNGTWDQGESGIYLGSGELVINNGVTTSKVLSFKDTKADIVPPKGYISTLQAPPVEPIQYELTAGKLILNGFAKDRGGNVVSSAVVVINNQEIPAQSVNAQYSEWTAQYTPTNDYEVLSIALKLTDSIGQTWTSPIYRLIIDVRQPDPELTTFSRSKQVIIPDSTDSSALTLRVVDENNDPLPSRSIQFQAIRDLDVLEADSVITDLDGKVTVYLTSTLEGNAIVQAFYGQIQLASTSVLVQPEGEADPTPSEPVELPGGLQVGDLIKGSLDAVYYLDQNGKRHVFVNQKTYSSWYGNDFSTVKTITDALLASIPLGDPVPFRPGTMLTSPSINEVYVVDLNRTLRHIGSEQVAKELFGDNWNTMIFDLQESLLFAYNFGPVISNSTEINLDELNSISVTINSEIVS